MCSYLHPLRLRFMSYLDTPTLSTSLFTVSTKIEAKKHKNKSLNSPIWAHITHIVNIHFVCALNITNDTGQTGHAVELVPEL